MLTGLQYSEFKQKAKYVATFGNSDPAVTGDWVRVLHNNVPDYATSEDQLESRRCPGLVTSLHIEILHARVGTFSDPQTKVLGVLYNFGTLTDQTFTCVGLACNHRSEPTVLTQFMTFLCVEVRPRDCPSVCPSPSRTSPSRRTRCSPPCQSWRPSSLTTSSTRSSPPTLSV